MTECTLVWAATRKVCTLRALLLLALGCRTRLAHVGLVRHTEASAILHKCFIYTVPGAPQMDGREYRQGRLVPDPRLGTAATTTPLAPVRWWLPPERRNDLQS